MNKQLKTLANPISREEGVSITKLEIDYVYFHDTSMQVYFKQGPSIAVPYTPAILKAFKDLEDVSFQAIDKPKEAVSPIDRAVEI